LLLQGVLYLLLGALAGLIAGLFGLGGGVVIVPALLFAFTLEGVVDSVAMHMAIATSLACIMVTSLGAMYEYQRRGAIVWPVVKWVAVGLLGGAVLGALLAAQLDGRWLKVVFVGFLLFVAGQMLLKARGKTVIASTGRTEPVAGLRVAAGTGIGAVSALLGIGGGVMSVPFYRSYFSMQQSVAMAGVGGFVLALGGAVSNAWLGAGVAGRPEWSLGYIYLPAFAGILLSSIVCARLGAKLASHIPELLLQRAFAVILLLVAVRMLFS